MGILAHYGRILLVVAALLLFAERRWGLYSLTVLQWVSICGLACIAGYYTTKRRSH